MGGQQQSGSRTKSRVLYHERNVIEFWSSSQCKGSMCTSTIQTLPMATPANLGSSAGYLRQNNAKLQPRIGPLSRRTPAHHHEDQHKHKGPTLFIQGALSTQGALFPQRVLLTQSTVYCTPKQHCSLKAHCYLALASMRCLVHPQGVMRDILRHCTDQGQQLLASPHDILTCCVQPQDAMRDICVTSRHQHVLVRQAVADLGLCSA